MKRLRYGVPDEQWALIEELAKIFSLDPKIVLQFSTSIGLRFLDMSLVHPLAGLSKAIDERADQGTAAIMSDFGKAIGQNAPQVEHADTDAKVQIHPQKAPKNKKTMRKRK